MAHSDIFDLFSRGSQLRRIQRLRFQAVKNSKTAAMKCVFKGVVCCRY